MDGPLCRAMYGTSGRTKSPQPCCLDHLVPRHQEVVITEVENAFRGVSRAESCCRQGQALAPGTVQLDCVVGRICLGTSAVGLLGKEALDDWS